MAEESEDPLPPTLSHPHPLADADTLSCKHAKASLRGERQSEGELRRDRRGGIETAGIRRPRAGLFGGSDQLDLDTRAGGQRGHADGAARWIRRLEKCLVDLIHGSEIAHVREKHIRFHHIAHA